MNMRILGKTGTPVSEVGLGTWQLGGVDWGVMNEKDALAILHKAADQGVTLFDTADVYGLGASERFIGKFLKEVHGTVHVATKLGRVVWVQQKGWPKQFTLAMARAATQQSLKNLGVDSIFLQQWHCVPTEWMRQGDIFEHLETLKKEGLIQNWGCSVESVEEGLLCLRHPGCSALQVIYNIFRQKLTTELLPAAQKNRVGILARVPLASGLLTGKFTHGQRFDEKDHRHYNADGKAFNVGETFAGLPFEKGVDLAEKVRAILKPTESWSMAVMALRWILDHQAVTAVIPGATKLSHVEGNVKASSARPLSHETHQALEELYRKEIAPAIRGPY